MKCRAAMIKAQPGALYRWAIKARLPGMPARVLVNALFSACLVLAAATAQAACNSDMQPDKPNKLYRDHRDGTVTDQQTGLVWQACSLGQTYDAGSCSGTPSTFTWVQALAAAQAANADSSLGFNDWRLPNVKELVSLLEYACFSPAINEALFPATALGSYWSSSPCASNQNCAWFVGFNFASSGTTLKTVTYRVRLVRAGF